VWGPVNKEVVVVMVVVVGGCRCGLRQTFLILNSESVPYKGIVDWFASHCKCPSTLYPSYINDFCSISHGPHTHQQTMGSSPLDNYNFSKTVTIPSLEKRKLQRNQRRRNICKEHNGSHCQLLSAICTSKFCKDVPTWEEHRILLNYALVYNYSKQQLRNANNQGSGQYSNRKIGNVQNKR